MKRLIEELIRKRREKQERARSLLLEAADMIAGGWFSRRKRAKFRTKMLEWDQAMREMTSAQDKEWDAYSNNHSTAVFKSLQWKIEKLTSEYAGVKHLLMNFIELEDSLERIIQKLESHDPEEGNLENFRDIKERLSVGQYAHFEERFRGTAEEVKKMLRPYLHFFADRENVLDVGCGRGEFLELLREAGIREALGVDISVSMLKTATEKGLRCIKGDALAFLKEAGKDSFGGIFSAQVIEHLTPEEIRELVVQARRALNVDSPLVLETVNPLSVFALSRIYFLDVTHRQPLHPEFMRYLLETSGFSEVEIIYTGGLEEEALEPVDSGHPQARPLNANVDRLNRLLYAAPAYAVKGYKRM